MRQPSLLCGIEFRAASPDQSARLCRREIRLCACQQGQSGVIADLHHRAALALGTHDLRHFHHRDPVTTGFDTEYLRGADARPVALLCYPVVGAVEADLEGTHPALEDTAILSTDCCWKLERQWHASDSRTHPERHLERALVQYSPEAPGQQK